MSEILLTRNQKATVDDLDYERISKFSWRAMPGTNNNFYAGRSFKVKGKVKTIFMHHEVFEENTRLDHIDGNGLNNERSNLRKCTASQNSWNRRKFKIGHSRFKGICFSKKMNKWIAYITKIHLGCFDQEIDAALAYNKAATKYFGEFANLNKI